MADALADGIEVYPRVCGGTGRVIPERKGEFGLSPRVRGNRQRQTSVIAEAGSIPACAGEPLARFRFVLSYQVYPRVCGGTGGQVRRRRHAEGLSPRVRGNPTDSPLSSWPGGSIPACAGEPELRTINALALRVYPRVCGGTDLEAANALADDGLSPRVRGNPEHRLGPAARRRSIPACAGEPWRTCWRRRSRGVYPRVCGGTPGPSGRPTSIAGLSPRVRGNRERDHPVRDHRGSIPACAGEPVGIVRT